MQHVRKPSDRKDAFYLVLTKLKYALSILKNAGIKCDYVTGYVQLLYIHTHSGGTGSFECEASSGLYTEIQPGSYIFMDADYGKNLDESNKPVSLFKQSLFVLSQVVSKSVNRCVLDAGLKALSLDSGVPLLAAYKTLYYQPGGDEHGIVKLQPDATSTAELDDLTLAQKVKLIPGHCDPTVVRCFLLPV